MNATDSTSTTTLPAVAGQLETPVRQRAYDGGPAFPTTPDNFDNMEPAGDGMSLRDYFAAHATDADIEALRDSVPRCTKVVSDEGCGAKRVMHNALPDNWRQIARYMHADRMLAVRAA